MTSLLTKDQARVYLCLETVEAAEKLLCRLGVPKIDYSLAGSKGIRYRACDIEEALSKIEISSAPQRSKRPRRPRTDLFDLPITEQVALLTVSGHKQ